MTLRRLLSTSIAIGLLGAPAYAAKLNMADPSSLALFPYAGLVDFEAGQVSSVQFPETDTTLGVLVNANADPYAERQSTLTLVQRVRGNRLTITGYDTQRTTDAQSPMLGNLYVTSQIVEVGNWFYNDDPVFGEFVDFELENRNAEIDPGNTGIVWNATGNFLTNWESVSEPGLTGPNGENLGNNISDDAPGGGTLAGNRALFQPEYTSQYVFEFDNAVNGFAFNFGGADNDWLLEAYDSDGEKIDELLIGNQDLLDQSVGHVYGFDQKTTRIARVTLTDQFTQSNAFAGSFAERAYGDYVAIDNITFATPIPAAAPLLLGGLAALGLMRGRRRA